MSTLQAMAVSIEERVFSVAYAAAPLWPILKKFDVITLKIQMLVYHEKPIPDDNKGAF